MKSFVRKATENDIVKLTQIYEKNNLAPTSVISEKSKNYLADFLSDKRSMILVCESGGKIVASCEVTIAKTLAFENSGTVLVSGVCYESEKNYEQICLLMSKIKEIACQAGCRKILFLNENCGGFLNSVYMTSGLHHENIYSNNQT